MAKKLKLDERQMRLNTWRTTYQSLLGIVAFVGTVIVLSDSGEIQVQWTLLGSAFATLVAYLDNVRRQNKEKRIISASTPVKIRPYRVPLKKADSR